MRLEAMRWATATIGVALMAAWVAADSPFAAEVVDFSPAPGQFVNVALYNDPTKALGAPVGGGTANPDNSKLVSLGGFGGSITLKFDHTVLDDPANPFGVDAIVFGNATWVSGNANRHWAECAVIEISRDVNGNGLPDDPWYLIPGTHITNPAAQFLTQTWDDNLADPTYPPTPPPGNPYPDWIPPGRSGVWQSSGYRLPSAVFDVQVLQNPQGLGATDEGVFGYSDFTPVLILGDVDGDNVVDDPNLDPADFYTVPDDPLTVGITPGSGGGDAFDIAWAVDSATGQPVHLTGFDFIRITNGENYVAGVFGELSPEIGGVADVAPAGLKGDLNCDGVIDNFDINPFVLALTNPAAYQALYPDCRRENADINGDGVVDNFDINPFVALLTGG